MKIDNSPVFKDGYPRTGFVFYQSFYEALQDIPNEDKMAIVQAIIEYGLYGKESDLQGLHKIVFTLIKPQIDANQKKFVNGQKGAEHGVKGGRPETINPTETPQEPQVNPTETRKEKEKVKENVKRKTKVFIPPSLEEFINYFIENGFSKELAERAYKGYDVAGWKDSKGEQIHNWKQKCQHVWFKPENKQINGNKTLSESQPYKQLGR